MRPDAGGSAAALSASSGVFVAVVGASGVGKDSLLRYVEQRLPGVLVARRVITRRPDGTEPHEPSSEEEFAALAASGGFAVWWRAHGLGYGLPVSIDTVLDEGRTVLANVSRAVLPQLAARYRRLAVVRVSVTAALRADRLAGRGREPAAALAERLARSDPAPGFPVDLELDNSGELADAGQRLERFLRALGEEPGASTPAPTDRQRSCG